jgi:hypothetical protein
VLVELSGKTVDVIGRCLDAWANGPFIEDWEFQTVTGLERDEVSAIAKNWPNQDDPNVDQAVLASMGNLLGYPHGRPLAQGVGYEEDDIIAARAEWKACRSE